MDHRPDPLSLASSPGQAIDPVCGMTVDPATRVEYFCPMHPEVVRDHPGSCPKCGMALEPRTVTVEEGPNPELVDMRRRFWLGLSPCSTLFLLAMAAMLPGEPLHFVNHTF